ncbi:c-type cytochrome biogenesis protein CcmI [Reinekea marina]|uniref:C-type cytochrome biogenesis protein CcmI n=1 Tax=Reinekea marina TaxID=1310421 RepID=A0ABV7WSQ4_9GAMM|nr:c-type cytochrome biogenesis protein CcmI [Reinekea marina]MDN3648903.1 c-type cytochrome biogenesis protein CcmI [Reinekea marina]
MLILSIWLIPIAIFMLFAVRHQSGSQTEVDSVEAAMVIHKDRLAALQQQFEANSISQSEFDSLRLEVEKSILADTEKQRSTLKTTEKLPWLWVQSLSLIVFATAFWLYQSVGASDAVDVRTQFRQLAGQTQLDEASVTNTLQSYQKLLEKEPENIEGWFRLARMQLDMGSFEHALISFNNVLTQLRAVERNAEDEAAILAYLGQTYLSLNRPEAALASFEEALEYSAVNTMALGMAGRIRFELGDYKEAIDHWTTLKLQNLNPENAVVIDSYIDQAKAALADMGIDYEAEQPLRIFVKIELPAAWEGLPEQASLFIYARPIGQRMPIAAKRVRVTDQSMVTILSDADAMGPAGVLTNYEQVEITARVSMNGTANTSPGDWPGDVRIVELNSKEISVDIDVRLP